MWRHQFMLAKFGFVLMLSTVAWTAPPPGQRVVPEAKNDLPRGLTPHEALSTFRLPPGFKIEIAACEPLVRDPIALDWGADGKLWVVEMGDYPLGVDGKGKPGGVVRFLEDTNGDGVYDKQTTFLDDLPFPTGVMPWRGGVLVASAPDIFYAEDRDGDGKADHREILFTGFAQGNQQHRLNGFDLGLDGWVYGANGDSGGTIRSVKTGKIVNIQGRDFRFQPDTGEFEAESGQTQYGRHRDDWGNWFGNNNPTWGWHFVLSDSDLRRNPYYAAPDPKQPLEPDTRLYPISRILTRFNDPGAAGHVTSANSPTPYRDDLFGPKFATSLFVSEPVHNLVHRMILEPNGASYRGVRAPGEVGCEFLASSDNWFRPTQMKTGPDGALWVADMYREVIEHPEWIPAAVQKRIDLRAGSQEGRIYRIYPTDRRPRPIPRLDQLDTSGLVAAFESPSGWQRDTAQRLLQHSKDLSAIEPLRLLVRTTKRPQTRLQAIWALAVLGGLDEATALAGLADPHPLVRRGVIKAGESLLMAAPRLAAAMLRAVDDSDSRVRLQLALSLGNWGDARAGSALARILCHDRYDPWITAAVLSSALPHVTTLLAELFRAGPEPPPLACIEPLVVLAGSSCDRPAIDSLIGALGKAAGKGGTYASWQYAALRGLLEGSACSRQPIDLAREPRLHGLFEAARRLARDDSATQADRIIAVGLIQFSAATQDEDCALLVDLLSPRVPIAISRAAIEVLGRLAIPQVPDRLLAGWKSYAPALRSSIIDILLSRRAWTLSLVAAIESARVAPGEIAPAQRNLLLASRDPETRRRAQTSFTHMEQSRQKVVDDYLPALCLKGDPAAGKAVFTRVCATCHRLGELGVEVGPNLGVLREKTPETLLISILDPYRAFESRYANFTVATNNGRMITGLVASETANSVTLRRQEGKEDVVLRTDIEEMTASGQSFMPEGLEKDLTLRDMADLIAFIQGVDPPPKPFQGNHPHPVKPGPDGTITLNAADAEVYGDRLVFEAAKNDLGYWMAANDRAVWRFDVAGPGKYSVWLDWACSNDAAGNVVEIHLGNQRIQYKVGGTGTWDHYSWNRIGDLELSGSENRLEVRPAAAPKNELLDLRCIELRPLNSRSRVSAVVPDRAGDLESRGLAARAQD
jgi:putative membrane-bound dehydrogenase-like protein